MRQISKKFNELITGTPESKMNKAMAPAAAGAIKLYGEMFYL